MVFSGGWVGLGSLTTALLFPPDSSLFLAYLLFSLHGIGFFLLT
jgi:hypothetical protein